MDSDFQEYKKIEYKKKLEEKEEEIEILKEILKKLIE